MTIAQRMNYKRAYFFPKRSSVLRSKFVFASLHLWRIRAHLSSNSGVFRKKQHLNHRRINNEKVLAL